MGTGPYKGGASSHHSIGDNLGSLKESYSFNNSTGYFGDKGGSGQTKVRNIASADPISTAQAFYNKAAYGGIETPLPNGKGVHTEMKDGTILTFREVSHSDGTPAVDINISKSTDSGGIKTQKIHFTKG